MKINCIYNSIYIGALLLMMGATSCQKEDLGSELSNDSNAVKINATISGLTSQTRVNTEDNGDTWQDNDEIKVINTSTDAGKKEGVYKYTTEGSQWAPQGSNYMVWTNGENTFQAFYPYTEGTSNSFTQFEIPYSQVALSTLRKADWMTAIVTTPKTNDKAVNLAFKHELVKVTMKIVKYNDQYSSISSSLMFVSNQFTVPTTPMQIESKSVTIEKASDWITGYIMTEPITKLRSFTAILPPGKFNAGETVFKLMVMYGDSGDDELFVKVPVGNVLTTTGLEAGKAYTFELTMGKDKATIGNVTVADWNTGEIINEGTEQIVPLIGDYYYTDGNYSTVLDPTKEVIGLIYWIDPINPKHVKIVSLDESKVAWSTSNFDVGKGAYVAIRDAYPGDENSIARQNGAANRTILDNFITANSGTYSIDNFPAFKAANEMGSDWYLPALSELQYLYCAWNGAELKSWHKGIIGTPVTNNDAQAAFNAKLTAASGTALAKDFYWAATEYSTNFAWFVRFTDSFSNTDPKMSSYRVRLIRDIIMP